MAQRQLLLISTDERTWKLDERTKAVGRAGVARARQALTTRTDRLVDHLDRPAA